MPSFNRRRVLKSIGTIGATVGFAGAASGNERTFADEVDRFTREYATLEARRQAFASNATSVLEELSERSLIESASVERFPLDRYSEPRTRFDPSEPVTGTAVTAAETDAGELTPLLMSMKTTDEHTIRLFVKPRSGKSYALVDPVDDGESFAIDPSVDGSTKLTQSSCSDSYYCGDRCDEEVANCFVSGTELFTTHYVSCYERDGSCSCYDSGSDCGAEDCWRTCS